MSEYPVKASLVHTFRTIADNGIAKLARWIARNSCVAAITASAAALGAADAAAETRSLKLFFTHTGERATIAFKRDGKFDAKGLAQINRFLRDWRRNEPARMDPRLLDLVWEVYQRSGANGYINIVSAYRSPATNNMLRGRSRNTGVAKNSQHMLGKAMDFYIPGVKLAKLRAIAMQMQIGGVGYYPTSGSPFVHLDVGRVRAWPRMSRQELVRIFPNGKTLHVPADGRPLPGYNVAMVDYKRRVSAKSVAAASTASGALSEEDDASQTDNLVTALLPTRKSRAERALELQTSPQSNVDQPAFVDLATISVPLPTFRAAKAERALPANLSAFVPSASFKATNGLRLTGRTLRQPTTAETSATGFGQEMRPVVWIVSDEALLDWALAPTEALERLALPTVLQRTFASADETRRGAERVHQRDQPGAFNQDRFGSDG
ncbi:DUF882 domain-containing protein [Shinella sp. CPCC 100929]|uniref:Murein endopeptidase K n=1 Tax=Shinella lacus TaxID=2654216 RepID=A0ABT1RE00_9HYPH|nr:DUF882 domain-containing protein [Shinella lacus]